MLPCSSPPTAGGPSITRRVGQSVDLPGKARRWGHDLRGSPHGGCLKPWSRQPQPPSLSSEKAALIYQHSDEERQREVAAGLDDLVRAERAKRHKDEPVHHSEEAAER